jgi:integrase
MCTANNEDGAFMRKYRGTKDLAKLSKRGRYAVGNNVYLQISEWGTRSWVFRYAIDGKPRTMGLGPCDLLTLAEARERGHQARRQLLDGVDPLQAKRQIKRERVLAGVRHKTFREVALDYIAAHEDHWRGNHSRRQWLQSLQQYAFQVIGDTPIVAIDVAGVLAVLERARAVPETQKRIKNRLAAILDWAAARDLRSHENPAKRPHLLPKRKKQVAHFTALPYAEVPSFMVELRQRPEMAARALEFLILTAARPAEVLGARWSEISGDIWTVPGERMKGGKPHRVPLSKAAFDLLAHLPRDGEYVFAGRRRGRALAAGLVVLLRRMDRDVTAHGFRSSFRDWAAETTGYANHIVEMALAHAVGNGVEAAYRRGDLFEKRRRLMDDWARFCGEPAIKADVTPLRQRIPA